MVDQSRERVDNYERSPLRNASRGGPAQECNEVRKAGTCVVGEVVQSVEVRILALRTCGNDGAQALDGHAMKAICMTESASQHFERYVDGGWLDGPTHTTLRRSPRQLAASWTLKQVSKEQAAHMA